MGCHSWVAGLLLLTVASSADDAGHALIPEELETHDATAADPSSQQHAPSEETARRLAELDQWSRRMGDDISGVARLLADPALNGTVNDAIHLSEHGAWLDDREFDVHVEDVYRVHNEQTAASRRGLAERWSSGKPLLGHVDAWDLLRLLHFTVDNTDHHLKYTSQFIHCLQVRCMRPACRVPPDHALPARTQVSGAW